MISTTCDCRRSALLVFAIPGFAPDRGPGQTNCHNCRMPMRPVEGSSSPPHFGAKSGFTPNETVTRNTPTTKNPHITNSCIQIQSHINKYKHKHKHKKRRERATKIVIDREVSMSEEKKEEEINRSSYPKSPRFKFNVDAPEFIPRSVPQVPISGYFYPYLPFLGNGGYGLGPDWFYFGDQDPMTFIPDSRPKVTSNSRSNNDVTQKIVKQVEYQLSDTNLVASDFLIQIMNKDPEGYVPMSVIASWKKIKSLGANHQTLVKALKTSTKLVVSDDGKKVRRKQLFTERDREELQSCIVIVENLPEDYSRQNLEKIFSVVGSVKNIRICHPQEPNASKSAKADMLVSNKLHAFVEYETTDQADKAVEKLNDERNWRKGLRVRSMLRRSPRSVVRNKRSECDHFDNSEDDQSPQSQTSGSSTHIEQLIENTTEETPSSTKKSWGRGRAKSHSLVQNPSRRGLLSQSQQQQSAVSQNENLIKTTPQSPRMPDGTRGFTMGRGKPLSPVIGGPMLTAVGLGPIQL